MMTIAHTNFHDSKAKDKGMHNTTSHIKPRMGPNASSALLLKSIGRS